MRVCIFIRFSQQIFETRKIVEEIYVRNGNYYPSFLELTTIFGVLIQMSGRTRFGERVAQLLMVVAVHLKNAFMQKGCRFSRIQDKIVFLWVTL